MFQCHIYTDDIQLYIEFNLRDNSKSAKVNANIDKCSTIIKDIFFILGILNTLLYCFHIIADGLHIFI